MIKMSKSSLTSAREASGKRFINYRIHTQTRGSTCSNAADKLHINVSGSTTHARSSHVLSTKNFHPAHTHTYIHTRRERVKN